MTESLALPRLDLAAIGALAEERGADWVAIDEQPWVLEHASGFESPRTRDRAYRLTFHRRDVDAAQVLYISRQDGVTPGVVVPLLEREP